MALRSVLLKVLVYWMCVWSIHIYLHRSLLAMNGSREETHLCECFVSTQHRKDVSCAGGQRLDAFSRQIFDRVEVGTVPVSAGFFGLHPGTSTALQSDVAKKHSLKKKCAFSFR